MLAHLILAFTFPSLSAADVLDMFPDELAAMPMVRVTGVVTFVSADRQVMYVQDKTAGLVVPITPDMRVRPGERVMVLGRACTGVWCPILTANLVRTLGPGPMPEPGAFDLSQEMLRRFFGQFIEARGLVASADVQDGYSRLTIRGPGGSAVIMMPGADNLPAFKSMIGSVVRCRGVAALPPADEAVPTSLPRVLVNDRQQVVMLRTAEQVRGRRPRSIGDLRRAAPGPDVAGWIVRTSGTVVACLNGGRSLFISDDRNAIEASPAEPLVLEVGERVEVIGTAHVRGAFVTIDEAIVSSIGRRDAVSPISTTMDDLASGRQPNALVQLSGLVIERDRTDERTILQVRSGGRTIPVIVTDQQAFAVPIGARVSITGVHRLGSGRNPVVEMRPNDDVVILESPPTPPWFSSARFASIAAVLVGLLILGTIWTVLLRREVRRRTRELAESEEKFATAFRASPDAIVMTTLQEGTILEVNDGFCQLTGHRRDEVIGKSSTEIGWADPADRQRMIEAIGREGRLRNYQTVLLDSAGNHRQAIISSDRISLRGQACLLGVIRDVTVEHEQRAVIERSERKFSTLFNGSPIGLAITHPSDGKIAECNSAFAKLIGRTREQCLGKSTLEMGVWEDPKNRLEFIAELKERGRVAARDARLLTAQGDVREVLLSFDPVEVAGEIYAFGAVQDITERRRAERALESSERKFEALFRLSPVGMLLIQAEDGRVVDVNHGWETMMGYTRDEVVGRTSIELGLVTQAQHERLVSTMMTQGRLTEMEFVQHRNDGTEVIHMTSAEVAEIDGVPMVIVCINDVTARRRAEQALANTEHKLATLFRLSPVAISLIRVQDGVVVEVSPGFEELFGVRRTPGVEQTMDDMGIKVPPEARQRLRDAIQSHGRFAGVELDIVRPDGRTVSVISTSEIVQMDGVPYVVSASVDITERREAERALAAADHTVAALFQVSPVALCLARLDGTIVNANQAFADLCVCTPDQLIGKATTALPFDMSAMARDLGRIKRLRHLEHAHKSASGEPIDTVTSAELVELDGVPHVLSATMDVTALKRAEEALREANANLEVRVAERTAELANVNAELESFCYSVSHDLRAPLRAIAGFSQAIQEDYADKLDTDGTDYLNRIRAAARRMGELIDDLLALSRVTRVEMARRPVDLSAIAHQVAELIPPTPGHEVQLIIADGMKSQGDPNLLRIVMDNLLSNAFKYSSKQPSARVEVGTVPHSDPVTYFVRDNGAGFDPRFSAKLFQPLQRLHRQDEFEGHGIGLATVRRIINRHGGTVWGEGAVGQGAVFYFTLGSTPRGHS